jgi:hypothetical protein
MPPEATHCDKCQTPKPTTTIAAKTDNNNNNDKQATLLPTNEDRQHIVQTIAAAQHEQQREIRRLSQLTNMFDLPTTPPTLDTPSNELPPPPQQLDSNPNEYFNLQRHQAVHNDKRDPDCATRLAEIRTEQPEYLEQYSNEEFEWEKDYAEKLHHLGEFPITDEEPTTNNEQTMQPSNLMATTTTTHQAKATKDTQQPRASNRA